MSKKGLIISGGGAFGAYGAGTLAALNKDYDVVAGISTGALMCVLVALNKFDTLRVAYTSVEQGDIFDKKWYRPSVFKKSGKLNPLSLLYVLGSRIFGKRESILTLDTTNNLRKLIDKFITEEDYNLLKEKHKEVVAGVVNINSKPSLISYFSSINESYEDFKDWIWASANPPIVSTLLKKKWFDQEDKKWYLGEWTDGGLNELAPFSYILESGCDEVDIILHRQKPVVIKERPPVEDLMQNIERSFESMRFDIEFKDGFLIEELTEIAKRKNIKITIYWLPRKLGSNSLLFDQRVMNSWWIEGYKTVNDSDRVQKL